MHELQNSCNHNVQFFGSVVNPKWQVCLSAIEQQNPWRNSRKTLKQQKGREWSTEWSFKINYNSFLLLEHAFFSPLALPEMANLIIIISKVYFII